MHKTVFEHILHQIAGASQAAPDAVREKMQAALISALENPDPSVQAMWNAIPKEGTSPTLDEFTDYLISKNLLLP